MIAKYNLADNKADVDIHYLLNLGTDAIPTYLESAQFEKEYLEAKEEYDEALEEYEDAKKSLENWEKRLDESIIKFNDFKLKEIHDRRNKHK